MRPVLFLFTVACTLFSCSKEGQTNNIGPVVIPDIINGPISEMTLTPINITTPDKGSISVLANNTRYKVDFNVTEPAQSNATFFIASDTILTNDSREIANVGRDAVIYYPVAQNEIEMRLNDGKRVTGLFDLNTTFGGGFGEQLISQWRTTGDPTKPNQKAKDDLVRLMHLYKDKDGPGPGTAPISVFVTISKP